MNDLVVKNAIKYLCCYLLYFSGVSKILLKYKLIDGLYVFNYHNFSTFSNSYWKFGSIFETGYSDNFKKQIDFFLNNLKRASLNDLQTHDLNDSFFMVTFDDGYKDNFQIAFPILRKKRIPSIFFVVTEYIGQNGYLWFDKIRLEYENKKSKYWFNNIFLKKKYKKAVNDFKKNFKYCTKKIDKKQNGISDSLMMDWADLMIASKNGIAIANHTCTHPIMSGLKKEDIYREIDTSQKKIFNELGINNAFFCYPDGSEMSINEDVLSELRKCGMRFAFTTLNGINRDLQNNFRLKRIGINPSDPVPVVAMKIILASFSEGRKK
jgi:peptidoglycan/xylan/chitin deacetylase (PgdA/CDA1 family)